MKPSKHGQELLCLNVSGFYLLPWPAYYPSRVGILSFRSVLLALIDPYSIALGAWYPTSGGSHDDIPTVHYFHLLPTYAVLFHFSSVCPGSSTPDADLVDLGGVRAGLTSSVSLMAAVGWLLNIFI